MRIEIPDPKFKIDDKVSFESTSGELNKIGVVNGVYIELEGLSVFNDIVEIDEVCFVYEIRVGENFHYPIYEWNITAITE